MIIRVKVRCNSDKQTIEKVGENEFFVYLTEKAEKNKANKELINILAKEFKVDFRTIKIKNPKSREKIIEVLDSSF